MNLVIEEAIKKDIEKAIETVTPLSSLKSDIREDPSTYEYSIDDLNCYIFAHQIIF